ncbi:MAG: hypothetical protein KDJ44_02370 [Rhodoblastus sp.]|nr:hypothetical protein [Rhodoblastus sp.]
MTVAELIEKLRELPPGMVVACHAGDASGYLRTKGVRTVRVRNYRTSDKGWRGNFDDAQRIEEDRASGAPFTVALITAS